MMKTRRAGAKTARGALVGRRLTSQRKLLYDLLRQSKGHPDVDQIYRQAKARVPRLSLSTVYRNLRLFKTLGLVEELHLVEEHHHYERRPLAEHYHLVCLGCNQVVEFQSQHIPQLKEEVSREQGFIISGAEVSLMGYCPRCRESRSG